MELSDALAGRRSCRSFEARAVDPALVRNIVAAARRAPSAGNTWSLDVVALTDRAAVDAYWDVTLPESRRHTFPWPGLLRAPVLLLPAIDPAAYVRRYGEDDKSSTGLGVAAEAWQVPYWWVDGGAAVMAMLLAATGSGLGSLLFGVFDHEAAVRQRFGIPGDRRLLGAIAVGWPDGGDRASRSARRIRPASADFLHLDGW